jgi:hypothetical protein
MFIGHFGTGLAAKKIDEKPSLGTLFFAAQFVDLLWPLFILTGIEKVKIEPGNTVFTPLNFIYYPSPHPNRRSYRLGWIIAMDNYRLGLLD